MLGPARNQQYNYPERTGIPPQTERYCVHSGPELRFGILPRRLDGRGGVLVVAAQCRLHPNGGSRCLSLQTSAHLTPPQLA